ncbi:MAG: hypothetical protein HY360_15075 [Verrucomicrobia bacterium]|nr:hypothetical protein [Verrucomicrobiota bacterium]
MTAAVRSTAAVLHCQAAVTAKRHDGNRLRPWGQQHASKTCPAVLVIGIRRDHVKPLAPFHVVALNGALPVESTLQRKVPRVRRRDLIGNRHFPLFL